jgi:hypothetical protein
MCERDDSQDVVEQSGIRSLKLAMGHAQCIEILVGYELVDAKVGTTAV